MESHQSLDFLQVVISDVLNNQGAHGIELESVLVDTDFYFFLVLALLLPESLAEPHRGLRDMPTGSVKIVSTIIKASVELIVCN
jgi:hypothetical protein